MAPKKTTKKPASEDTAAARKAAAVSQPELDDLDDEDTDEEEDDDDDEVAEAAPPAKGRRRAKVPPVVKDAAPDQPKVPLGSVAHVVFVLLAAIGVYSFVSVAKEGELRRRCTPTCILRPNYAGYEKKAPNFTLKDTKGHDVSIESFRGRVVVLNFWTKTCQPCMEEMPEIADLTRILKPYDDVAVLTVSTDETAQDANDTMKAVLNGEPPFPVLMDPEAKVVRGMFGTSLFPETWIIDKSGVIRARFDGKREWGSATVVELVQQIRGGGYCPAQAREGKFVGEAVRMCDGLSGG